MSEISNIQQQFGDHLFNFIKTKVATTEDAQDIYQEVIFKIINKSQQLTKAQSLKSWLFTIAKNQIIDFYRTRKVYIDIDSISSDFERADGEGTYYQLEGCIKGFINALPDGYKEIIILSEIEGKSQKELSEHFGINYVTLRSKVQRGREKIRKMIFEACRIDQDSSGRLVDCMPKSNVHTCGGATTCD